MCAPHRHVLQSGGSSTGTAEWTWTVGSEPLPISRQAMHPATPLPIFTPPAAAPCPATHPTPIPASTTSLWHLTSTKISRAFSHSALTSASDSGLHCISCGRVQGGQAARRGSGPEGTGRRAAAAAAAAAAHGCNGLCGPRQKPWLPLGAHALRRSLHWSIKRHVG